MHNKMKTAIVVCNMLAAIFSLLSAIFQHAEGNNITATIAFFTAFLFFATALIWANNKNGN